MNINEREILIAADGGTLALDWIKASDHHSRTPIVVLNAGVTGCSRSPYIKRLATTLIADGNTVVALNQRGINCELTVSSNIIT